MDRWMNNPNVVRIVALVLAVLLWALVQLEQNDATDQQNLVPNRNQERMINDVQVIPIGLDNEQYTLQSLEPGNVNISIKGRARDIDRVNLNSGDSRIVVDLSGLEEGDHAGIPIQPVGFPDGVEVEIYPSAANVVLEEIQGKEVPVYVELVGDPAAGLVAGDPMSDPGRVLVMLPENELDQVVAVKTTLDITGASEGVVVERKVIAIDANGQEVRNAVLSPSVVRVEVPVTSPFITVPLPVRLVGEPAPGYSVSSVEQDVKEVTLFGSEEVIQQYEFYGDLEVDISGISEATSYTLDIPVEDPLQRVHPEEVNVQVNVVPSNTLTLEGIPLILNGENEQAETTFVEPSSGTIDVTLEGAPTRLDQVQPENVRAVVDVSNLPPGTYELPVRLNLPQYIRYGGGTPLMVTVQISQDGEAGENDDAEETDASPDLDDPEANGDIPSGQDDNASDAPVPGETANNDGNDSANDGAAQDPPEDPSEDPSEDPPVSDETFNDGSSGDSITET